MSGQYKDVESDTEKRRAFRLNLLDTTTQLTDILKSQSQESLEALFQAFRTNFIVNCEKDPKMLTHNIQDRIKKLMFSIKQEMITQKLITLYNQSYSGNSNQYTANEIRGYAKTVAYNGGVAGLAMNEKTAALQSAMGIFYTTYQKTVEPNPHHYEEAVEHALVPTVDELLESYRANSTNGKTVVKFQSLENLQKLATAFSSSDGKSTEKDTIIADIQNEIMTKEIVKILADKIDAQLARSIAEEIARDGLDKFKNNTLSLSLTDTTQQAAHFTALGAIMGSGQSNRHKKQEAAVTTQAETLARAPEQVTAPAAPALPPRAEAGPQAAHTSAVESLKKPNFTEDTISFFNYYTPLTLEGKKQYLMHYKANPTTNTLPLKTLLQDFIDQYPAIQRLSPATQHAILGTMLEIKKEIITREIAQRFGQLFENQEFLGKHKQLKNTPLQNRAAAERLVELRGSLDQEPTRSSHNMLFLNLYLVGLDQCKEQIEATLDPKKFLDLPPDLPPPDLLPAHEPVVSDLAKRKEESTPPLPKKNWFFSLLDSFRNWVKNLFSTSSSSNPKVVETINNPAAPAAPTGTDLKPDLGPNRASTFTTAFGNDTSPASSNTNQLPTTEASATEEKTKKMRPGGGNDSNF